MSEFHSYNYLIRLPKPLLPFIVSMLKTIEASEKSAMLILFERHFEADFWGVSNTRDYSVSSIICSDVKSIKEYPCLKIEKYNCYYLLNLQDYLEALSECELQQADNNDTVYASLKQLCSDLQRAHSAGSLSTKLLKQDILESLVKFLTQYYKDILILQCIMDKVLQKREWDEEFAFHLQVVPEFPVYLHELFGEVMVHDFNIKGTLGQSSGLKDVNERFTTLTGGVHLPSETNPESCAAYEALSSEVTDIKTLVETILKTECWRFDIDG